MDILGDPLYYSVGRGSSVKEMGFKKELASHIPYINKFCRKFGVRLVNVRMLNEGERQEFGYEFSDNMGLYTIKAIMESLQD